MGWFGFALVVSGLYLFFDALIRYSYRSGELLSSAAVVSEMPQKVVVTGLLGLLLAAIGVSLIVVINNMKDAEEKE